MPHIKHVKAAILAGGVGERLYPLTRGKAKPRVSFEKRSLIDFPISCCINSSGISSVEVLIQAFPNQMMGYIEDTYLANEFGTPIRCRVAPMVSGTERFKGTADALRQRQFLFRGNHENLLILSGDHLYKMDFDDFISAHIDSGAAISIMVQRVPVSEASRFGVFNVNDEGKIRSFREKPSNPKPIPGTEEAYVSLGIYIFNSEKLNDLLDKCSGNDFGKDIIPYALSNRIEYPVNLYEYNGYWRDVGTILSLWEANMELVSASPPINMYDEDNPIYHKPRHLPSPKFIDGSKLIDSIVSDGSIIAGELNRSVLSTRIRVGNRSNITESVIFDQVKIGDNVKLHRVIVDEEVEINSGVKLGFDLDEDLEKYSGLIEVVDDILVVRRGAVICPR